MVDHRGTTSPSYRLAVVLIKLLQNGQKGAPEASNIAVISPTRSCVFEELSDPTGSVYCSRTAVGFFLNIFRSLLVEAPGVEPGSEEESELASTCVSNNLIFAHAGGCWRPTAWASQSINFALRSIDNPELLA